MESAMRNDGECCQSAENRYLPQPDTKKDNPGCRLSLQFTQMLDSVRFIRDSKSTEMWSRTDYEHLSSMEAMLPMNIYPLHYAKALGRAVGKLFSWMLFEIYGQSFPTWGLGQVVLLLSPSLKMYVPIFMWQDDRWYTKQGMPISMPLRISIIRTKTSTDLQMMAE